MRQRFDFSMHVLSREDAERGEVDPTLALMGAQGWQIQGLTTTANGSVLVALQRQQAEEMVLPDAPALATALAEPLTVPPLGAENP